MNVASSTPGVVLKTKFITANQKAFQEYVEYVDREEAQKEERSEPHFSHYHDYMDNPEKTSALFTKHADQLNKEEKQQLKILFETAQKNQSIMWQDVITFHNPWLEENGLYDARTHTVNEQKLMHVTRQSMEEMLKREKLDQSAVWSAAIHYNTQNIHIHIATVEPDPTRKRGKRKPQTLDAMKSKVVNQILERGDHQKEINELIRTHMVDKKKQDSSVTWKNRHMKPLFLQIYNHLPIDKRKWQYGYQTIKPLKPLINTLSQHYIEKHHQKEYQQLLKKLDEEVKELKKAYGDGANDQKRYKDYKQNKIDELYQRMGNAFLQEMKAYDKKKQRDQRLIEYVKTSKRPKGFQQHVSMHASLKRMEQAFKSEYESWKNQQHYERMQRESQRNGQHQYEDERGY
ncbi:MobP2 family relaxase [Priestia aryabhattai]|uniref:MobP2 family relaxase n=1 Tax=Priestia TaxID=2800373 RepID=UPI001E47D562|nr:MULTISPECIES: MobP2 family relaxase [Priestia]MCE4093220.1 relaxase MobL [Priestia megaterium]MED3821885.1 MobP2 family relaxase [Priestia aryabhattai]